MFILKTDGKPDLPIIVMHLSPHLPIIDSDLNFTDSSLNHMAKPAGMLVPTLQLYYLTISEGI